MNNILGFLEGKKTYIAALIAGATAVAQVLGYTIPDWVFTALSALGLYGVRSAMAKNTPSA